MRFTPLVFRFRFRFGGVGLAARAVVVVGVDVMSTSGWSCVSMAVSGAGAGAGAGADHGADAATIGGSSHPDIWNGWSAPLPCIFLPCMNTSTMYWHLCVADRVQRPG